jgi:hypothetical protein
MFNLEQAIKDWRRQMAAEGIKASRVLDELESHLRDDIKQQTRSGTSVQSAFGMALENLGGIPAIKDEFRKTRKPSSTIERMLIGICGAFVGLIVFLSSVAIVLCFSTWDERLMASVAVVAILLVALGWKTAVPFLPVIASARLRWGVGLTCIASGFIASNLFCEFILPHFEISPDHQLPAIGLWAVFLIAVFACAGVGLVLTERQREMWGMTKSALAPHAAKTLTRKHHV